MAAATIGRVSDPASVSYWLETSGDDLTPRPPLDGSAEADVAILWLVPLLIAAAIAASLGDA